MSYETSSCCDAPIVDESIDVCSDCLEHCTVIENEDEECDDIECTDYADIKHDEYKDENFRR